jgi:hypothetical protein
VSDDGVDGIDLLMVSTCSISICCNHRQYLSAAIPHHTTGKQIMAEEKRRLQEEEEEDTRLKQEDEEDEEEGQRVQPPKQLEYPGFGIITLTTEYISNCAV